MDMQLFWLSDSCQAEKAIQAKALQRDSQLQLPEIQFSIQCSKGTYIRSIARDFGNALGCGAYLSSLRRTHIGQYSLENPFDFSSLIINKEEKTLNNRKKRDFEIDTNIIC